MRIVPSSTINLYSNIPIDNGEQLVFSSLQAQTAYFNNHLVRSYTPCTMMRKTGALRVEIAGSVISTCNYISFVNPDFDNKTIYARIMDYDYVNNECVEIRYAIDYWQTWMFDVSFDDMYIDREHLSQADHAKADANPYDPTIYEYRTAESLAISEDIEKPYYDIGADESHDGYFIGESVTQAYGVNRKIGALVYLADIDFSDLDSGETIAAKRASFLFKNLILSVAATSLGYVALSQAQYEYLHGLYPNDINSYVKAGATWVNARLAPNASSRVHAEYTTFYFESAADYTSIANRKLLSDLLKYCTQWNCVSSIIGIYMIPNNLMLLSGVNYTDQGATSVVAEMTVPRPAQGQFSKKLQRYPFSYLRLVAPNGDKKELRYEDFENNQSGRGVCYVNVLVDGVEHPTLIAAPDNYKASGMSPNTSGINANFNEALVFNQFPTMPYNIDAYLAQVASYSANLIGNSTLETEYKTIGEVSIGGYLSSKVAEWASGVRDRMDALNSKLGLKTDNVLDPGGAYQDFKGALLGAKLEQASMYGKTLDLQNAQMSEAAQALAGGADGTAIGSNLARTKPAYAANQYHMSNGDGTINFNQLGYVDIIFLRVQLNPAILSTYDRYFMNYGYSSGRCGIPRVIRFTQGASSANELPEWVTLNGKTTTYIKTMDCKVTHSMIPVAGAIKSMFDSGVRMIKGD